MIVTAFIERPFPLIVMWTLPRGRRGPPLSRNIALGGQICIGRWIRDHGTKAIIPNMGGQRPSLDKLTSRRMWHDRNLLDPRILWQKLTSKGM